MRNLRLGLAQINATVGALDQNRRKILSYIEEARANLVDVIVFPELSIPGYPPEDLLLKPQFIADNLLILNALTKQTQGITAIIGFVDREEDIYNAAAVACNGRLIYVYRKCFLPNYGVFDEERYFQKGERQSVFSLNGVRIGVSICEDIWYPEGPPYVQALAGGTDLVININASPYNVGKAAYRERMLATRAQDNMVMVAYVNLVGGQDELVFDGGSLVFDQKGELLSRGKAFEEQLLVVDLDLESVFRARLHDPRRRKEKRAAALTTVDCYTLSEAPFIKRPKPVPALLSPLLNPSKEIYRALTLGVHDYVIKNGFSKVLIGLSGGIDSSLTATIAVDALGRDNVVGVFMPSRYTSKESSEDVDLLVKALGIELSTFSIEKLFEVFLQILSEPFAKLSADLTEENLQSRIRGNLLMALSNKFGWLVLTTGNKSELSVGYATLYGDLAGGFAVIKDLFKMRVYELARYRNNLEEEDIIPQRVLTKTPSAELKFNQSDQDTLPPYDLLDAILQAYVEEDRSVQEILPEGYSEKIVTKVIAMVDGSEFKRRQAPVGIKITQRALGKDRRMPITNRYDGGYSKEKARERTQVGRRIMGEKRKEKT